MNHEPHDPHEDDEPQLPPDGEPGPLGAEREREVGVEFGHLELIAPEGDRWDEYVAARGIAEAQAERHPIDDRTAYYIAQFLGKPGTPTLREFVATGTIDMNGLRREVGDLVGKQTEEVETWIAWFAHYCVFYGSREPIENWRTAIRDQDREDVEWLRREQIFAALDELFQTVLPYQRVPNAGQPGWYGLVYHAARRGGGLVIFEGGTGERRVWETDSDEELSLRYTAIVEAQRQWIVDTFGGMGPNDPGAADEGPDVPDDPPPSAAE